MSKNQKKQNNTSDTFSSQKLYNAKGINKIKSCYKREN